MSQNWRWFPFARLREFHDGDTVEVEVDQGFGGFQRVSVRVFGLSAPEVTGAEKPLGLSVLERVRVYETLACDLWTWKHSFDRYVGRIVLAQGKLVAVDLARRIIAAGLGRAWDGKTTRPDPRLVDVAADVAEYDRILAREFKP